MMKNFDLLGCLVLPLLIFLVFPGSMAGQVDEKPLQLNLHHDVDVTLKLIQVYVFDKEGNAVTDLELTDFILLDNGEKKTLTEFEKHILKKSEKTTDLEQTLLPPSSTSRMNRKFFLLFDFAFNNIAGIKRSKTAALHFIDTQLLRDDEVGILSYSATQGLTLHEYLTRDRERIRHVVENIEASEVLKSAVDGRGAKWEALAGVAMSFGGEGKNGLGGLAGEEEAERFLRGRDFNRGIYKRQTLDFSSRMKELAQSLRYIPGYKHIVLFSGGILNFIVNQGEVRSEIENMIEELDASSSPVYSVNVAGSGVRSNEPEYYRSDHSLRDISKLTGGKYFENIGNVEGIMEDIQNLTSAYYVLGYYIDEKWDGKRHSIKVKVKQRGYDIYAQKGFFNPKPFSKYSKYEKMLHLIDLAVSENPYFQNPMSFSLTTVPFIKKGDPYLLLLTKIPRNRLEEAMGNELEIISLVFDDDNNLVEMRKSNVNLEKLKREIFYYTAFHLLPGSYMCKIVVRDHNTGAGAVASSKPVEVQNPESGLIVFAPLLLFPEEDSLYYKASNPDDPQSQLSLEDILILFPDDHSPCFREVARKTQEILVLIRYAFIGEQEDQYSLSFRLQDLQMKNIFPISWSLEDQKDTKEEQAYLFKITLPSLNPGDYLLMISATDKEGGAVQSRTTSLRVK